MGPVISLREVLAIFEDFSLPEDTAKEIEKLHRYSLPEARTADRIKASEMLAKYRSMFVEHKVVDVTAAVTIVDDIK